MTTDELRRDLELRGIEHQLEPFEDLYEWTAENRLVHCLFPRADDGRRHAAFWLQVGRQVGFVGLWSGHLYQVREVSTIGELASALLRDCLANRRGTPWCLPEPLVRQYDVQECTLLHLWPRSVVDTLAEAKVQAGKPRFSAEEFLAKVGRRVDTCAAVGEGIVSIRQGQAQAAVRFRGEAREKQLSLALLCYGSFPWAGDEVHLLRTVNEAIEATAYDPHWNNRIDWDDPYYSARDADSGPDSPGNAHVEE